MNFLISPTEPKKMRKDPDALVDSYPEQTGSDIVLFTKLGEVLIQRKTIGDFLASISDGRLASGFAKMREASTYRRLLIEGRFSYNKQDRLVLGLKEQRYTRKAIQKLLWTVDYVEGISIDYSRNIPHTLEIIRWLQEWMDTNEHDSIHIRPKPSSENWFIPSYKERYLWWLQGCGPGISIGRAKMIEKVFKNPIEIASAYADGSLREKLLQIHRIGDTTVQGLINFWEGSQ